MQTNVRKLEGNWDDGYALDKHLISSTFIGYNEHGHPQFDNQRTEVGEAVYQLKYRSDFSRVPILVSAIQKAILPMFGVVDFVVEAPATNDRKRQPVAEIAAELSKQTGIPHYSGFVSRINSDRPFASLKNLRSKEEKVAALKDRFVLGGYLTGDKKINALVVDDLYESGATMEAVCELVRDDPKVGKIYVAALTWRAWR